MPAEQSKPEAPMSPVEAGKAVYDLQQDIFSALSRNPAYQAALHDRFVGYISPTYENSDIHRIIFPLSNTLRVEINHDIEGRGKVGQNGVSRDMTVVLRHYEGDAIAMVETFMLETWYETDDNYPRTVKRYVEGETSYFANQDSVIHRAADRPSLQTVRQKLAPLLGEKKQDEDLTPEQLSEEAFRLQQDLIDGLRQKDPNFDKKYGANFGSPIPVTPSGKERGIFWIGDAMVEIQCNVMTPDQTRDPNEKSRFMVVNFFRRVDGRTISGDSLNLESTYDIDPTDRIVDRFLSGTAEHWYGALVTDTNPLTSADALRAAREKLSPILGETADEQTKETPVR